MEVKSRDEIEEKYHWDLASIFATDEVFLQALEEAKGYPVSYTHLPTMVRIHSLPPSRSQT